MARIVGLTFPAEEPEKPEKPARTKNPKTKKGAGQDGAPDKLKRRLNVTQDRDCCCLTSCWRPRSM